MSDIPVEAAQAAWWPIASHSTRWQCIREQDVRDILEAAYPILAAQVRRETAAAYDDLLGSIWLYIAWWSLTKHLTTEQKELFADAVDAWGQRVDSNEPFMVDRWWRTDSVPLRPLNPPPPRDSPPGASLLPEDRPARPDVGDPMLMAAEKTNEAATRELISAEEFDALTDKVLKHDTYCPCRHCGRMDELMNTMCVHAYCRKEPLPGRWGCDEHPHHGPEAHEH